MLQEQVGIFSWSCITCNEQNDYYLKKCPYCGGLKEQFCKQMRTDCNNYFQLDASNYNKDFQKLGIIDFVCNQSEDRKEILELIIAKIKLSESEHEVISSKQLIVKPYLIPLIQNPEYHSITQEQADNGISFDETFKFLDADIFIFESQEKAKIYLNQCKYYNLQCPIVKYIELKRVFPNSNGQLNLNGMLKALKIPYDSECFLLAEVVNELLDRSFRFDIEMIQSLSFPIPEEEKRIQGFDNIVILDFEATCQRENNKKYNQEIIEFPAQVYNVSSGVVTKTYWKYIRPVEDPILSEFCTELTGITQDLVDNGILLEQSLNEFIDFLKGLGRYCILTCGDYDLHLLKKEATRKNIEIPKGLKFYINIKKGIDIIRGLVFPKHLRNPQCVKDPCMVEMLELCGLDLQGRHHSGIDDVKNITRIVDFLIKTENFRFDERMLSYTFKV